MKATTIIKKAAIAAKETTKLAASVAVGYAFGKSVSDTARKVTPDITALSAVSGVAAGFACYTLLETVDAIAAEKMEKIKYIN